SPVFSFYVGQDRKNPEIITAQFYQGGTTLPDRDFYLKDDARSLKIQEAYNKYITTLFTLIGVSEVEAANNANFIFSFEKVLANAQMSRVEMRDPHKTYNKLAVTNFSRSTPNINWNDLMKNMLVKGEDSILVDNPTF